MGSNTAAKKDRKNINKQNRDIVNALISCDMIKHYPDCMNTNWISTWSNNTNKTDDFCYLSSQTYAQWKLQSISLPQLCVYLTNQSLVVYCLSKRAILVGLSYQSPTACPTNQSLTACPTHQFPKGCPTKSPTACPTHKFPKGCPTKSPTACPTNQYLKGVP